MKTDLSKSPFLVGVRVAVITSGWTRMINPAHVYKVRKDYKFFIRYGENETTQMWTPREGFRLNEPNIWEANQSGKRHYSREHIEIWFDEHDVEVIERERLTKLGIRMHEFQDKIARLRVVKLTEERMTSLEEAMASYVP